MMMARKAKSAQLEKIEVRNRWTGNVQFTAEIETTPDMMPRIKLGLAARWGYRSRAVLSDADLSGADLSDADLSGAYLSGADLSDADLSGADLSGADLSDADLSDADLSGADLSGAYLSDADLSDAYLSGADLSDADLSGADLSGAYLSDADLSGADWIPKIENIHQRVYDAASAPQALDMGTWHKCETTHCRAGWVVTLAGEGGKVLEGVYGPAAAAALIYQASDPGLERIPNFYATNADALADMKRLAEQVSA